MVGGVRGAMTCLSQFDQSSDFPADPYLTYKTCGANAAASSSYEMDGKHSLSATNLAVCQHLNCDLYIHNVYNGSRQGVSASSPESELTKAQCKRGLDWETSLYSWLDHSKLLLKVPSMPLEASSLLENIQADDRAHFFITGLTFWPPQAKLAEIFFARARTEPFNFGLAKPDLLEIKRSKDGIIKWRVLDAKASKYVKVWPYLVIQRTAFSFANFCSPDLSSHPNLLLYIVLEVFARTSPLPGC
jgi:hypothetical protein